MGSACSVARVRRSRPDHDGRRQRLLGLEVLVEASFGDTDIGRDVVHRRHGVTLGGQQPGRGVQDRLLADLELAFAKTLAGGMGDGCVLHDGSV
jgi:hypothetical protein